MRGVLGVAFLVLGIVGGYLVMSGKFPTSGPVVSPAASTSAAGTDITTSTGSPTSNAVSVSGTGNGGPDPGSTTALGIPTVKSMADLAAHRGVY